MLAESAWRMGQIDAAESMCKRILASAPTHSSALHLMGVLAGERAQYKTAEALLTQALLTSKHPISCHFHLGIARLRDGRFPEAISSFEQALALDPTLLPALENIMEARWRMDDLAGAIASCRKIMDLNPSHKDAPTNLGVLLSLTGQHDSAIDILRDTARRFPESAEAHWHLSQILLLTGQYAEGWREYEWRWFCKNFPSERRHFSQPVWRGEFCPGKTILVHAEQGFGDTIQFLRYLPLLRELSGARVVLECQLELARLVAGSIGDQIAVVTRSDDPPSFDLQIPLLSLPYTTRKVEPLTMASPYLHTPPISNLNDVRALCVALIWAGSTTHLRDRDRSIALEQLASILETPDVQFYSLQSDYAAELPVGISPPPICIRDFCDTAALMSQMDLIITVDTASAHLAGALGRRVWTLLPFVPDWRWGLDTDGTPWYPTMRLFRQRESGDWNEVLQRVCAELRNFRLSRADMQVGSSFKKPSKIDRDSPAEPPPRAA